MFAQIVARTFYPLICSNHGKRSTQTWQVMSLLIMSFKINVVQADGKFSMQQWKRLSIDKCLIFEINIWIGNGWFYMIGTPQHAVLIKDHKTRLLFPSPVYYGPSPMSHAVVRFTLCLFFYSQWLTSCLVQKASGDDHLSGQDFNRHITWLHVTVRSHTVIWTNNRYNVDFHYNCMVNLTRTMVK